uniref:AB hydrolase-1 domain-containing protein n=1 Tax=Acrobeloides nanus TaxID=290746 RepID=A0A914BXG0_9BILA
MQNYGNYFVTKHHPKPKVLDGWNHGFLKLSTGVELHYVESGQKSSPLMLCLHGFPEFWYTWRYQLRYFNKSYRVIAVDMRGYGDSSKPKGYQNYKLDIVVDDIIATIGALGI